MRIAGTDTTHRAGQATKQRARGSRSEPRRYTTPFRRGPGSIHKEFSRQPSPANVSERVPLLAINSTRTTERPLADCARTRSGLHAALAEGTDGQFNDAPAAGDAPACRRCRPPKLSSVCDRVTHMVKVSCAILAISWPMRGRYIRFERVSWCGGSQRLAQLDRSLFPTAPVRMTTRTPAIARRPVGVDGWAPVTRTAG